MEVLIVGRPGLERSNLELFLVGAGHEVCFCHDGRWGCVGMDGTCPLDERAIDVATAHTEASDRFDPHGIACVYRADVALVAIGATNNDPVLQYATIAVDRVDDELLESIETIRIARLPDR